MIFGLTSAEKKKKRDSWRRTFVIYPRKLIDGRTAMFEWVERSYRWGIDNWKRGRDGEWKHGIITDYYYRIPEDKNENN